VRQPWIAFFRNTDSSASRWVADGITSGAELMVPEVVVMELLIGSTDDEVAARRRRFLQRFTIEPLAPLRDSEDAAAIHRRCRRAGKTVRSLTLPLY
jgi:predicted nucleic acid-binding protein